MDRLELVASPRATPSPAQLVAEAFADAYRRLVVQLYLATGDLAEAELVVQEAYVRARSAPTGFVEAVDPETWLRAVAFGRHHARVHRLRGWAQAHGGAGFHRASDGDGDRLEGVLEVVRALRRLPPRQREVLALRDLAALTAPEVAATLHVSQRTVEARLARARARLDRCSRCGMAPRRADASSRLSERAGSAVQQARAHRGDAESLVEPPEVSSIERRGRRHRRRRVVTTATVLTTVVLAGAGGTAVLLDRVEDAAAPSPDETLDPWDGAAYHRWRLSRGPGAPRARVTLGKDWTGGLTLEHRAGAGSVGLLVAEVDRVARTPCVREGQALTPVSDDPREVASSIAGAPGLEERGPARRDTAFGRLAELRRLRTTDEVRCPLGGPSNLLGTPQGEVVTPAPGTALDVWVFDVGGHAVVVMGSSTPDADRAGRALLTAALSTVVLDVTSSG